MKCGIGEQETQLTFRATGGSSRVFQQPVGSIALSRQGAVDMALNLRPDDLNLLRVRLMPEEDKAVAPLFSGEYQVIGGQPRFTLPLSAARLMGMYLRILPGAKSITHWANPSEFVLWPITDLRPGKYRICARIGTIAASRLAFNAGGKTMIAEIPNLQDYDAFRPYEFGVLEIPRSQEVWLQVFPVEGYTAVNLSELELELLE